VFEDLILCYHADRTIYSTFLRLTTGSLRGGRGVHLMDMALCYHYFVDLGGSVCDPATGVYQYL
jgi:hypothetical protein